MNLAENSTTGEEMPITAFQFPAQANELKSSRVPRPAPRARPGRRPSDAPGHPRFPGVSDTLPGGLPRPGALLLPLVLAPDFRDVEG